MISKETQLILTCLLVQHEDHEGDFRDCKDEFCEQAWADMKDIIATEVKLEAVGRDVS